MHIIHEVYIILDNILFKNWTITNTHGSHTARCGADRIRVHTHCHFLRSVRPVRPSPPEYQKYTLDTKPG